MYELMPIRGALRQIPSEGRLIAYPADVEPSIAFFARTTLARNPYVEQPPAVNLLAGESSDASLAIPGGLKAAHSALNVIANTPGYWRTDSIARYIAEQDKRKTVKADGPPPLPSPFPSGLTNTADDAAFAYSLMGAMKVAIMQGNIPRPRIRIRADRRYNDSLQILAAEETPNWTLETLARGTGDGGLADNRTDPQNAALFTLFCAASCTRVMASGYFAGIKKGDGETEEEAQFKSTARRSFRLMGYFDYFRTRRFHTALCRVLTFLLEPTIMERLSYIDSKDRLLTFEERARAVLARPTDPWHAQALRFGAPATRSTVAGAARSIGLPTCLLKEQPQFESTSLSDHFGIDDKLKAALSPRRFYDAIYNTLSEYTLELDRWKDIYGLEELEKAVGAVHAGPPIDGALWGPDVRITYGTPREMSESVSDPLDFNFLWSLPAALPAEKGSLTPYRFTSSGDVAPRTVIGGRLQSKQLGLQYRMILGVEPEDRPRTVGDDLAGILPPQHIQWFKEAYQGEAEYILIGASDKDISTYMGITVAELQAAIAADERGWMHIFEAPAPGSTGQAYKLRDPIARGGLLFVSELTRRPWLTAVPTPDCAPGWSVVFDRGDPTVLVPIVARIAITPEAVTLPISTDGVINKLINEALSPFYGTKAPT